EPNVMGRTSGTPLFAAIRQADAEMVRLLLAHGADANGRGAMSWTPLMEAARGDRLEIARLLVAAGAELGATDAHGETAAQVAAMSGASRTARFLMQMGGNTKEILGLLLVTAAEKGDDADVGRLLAEGADLNAQRTYSGGAVDSALSAALAGSHDSTARVLLAAGADPNLGGTVRTPLAAAAGDGRRGGKHERDRHAPRARRRPGARGKARNDSAHDSGRAGARRHRRPVAGGGRGPASHGSRRMVRAHPRRVSRSSRRGGAPP